ncbi:hypothetical protein [Streptomyces chartreusis]|uniref:hypothetical protein n=1 Tax=Streptomyces chartreusis TaxID=1969 RepID=UPI0036559E4A
MSDLIPAAPGWYVQSRTLGALDPVIAWTTAPDLDGGTVLLPYVPAGRGFPPEVLDLKAFPRDEWQVVYLPTYDPGEEAP